MNTLVFLDSNLLVYAVNKDSPFYTAARTVIGMVNAGRLQVCLSPQVLGEFYATVTNPRKLGRALAPEEAAHVLERVLVADIVAKIYPGRSTLGLTLDLARRYELRGADFFDAQIVATMLDNEVTTIYTANEKDFARFEEIEAINPFSERSNE
jgi:hypothetical protein